MDYQNSRRAKLTKWLYVIRGDEEMLVQLEEKWNLVQMQVDWKLEPLFSYSDAIAMQQSGVSCSEPPTIPESSTLPAPSSSLAS